MTPTKSPIPAPMLIENTRKLGLKNMPNITPIALPKIIPNGIRLSIKTFVFLDFSKSKNPFYLSLLLINIIVLYPLYTKKL